MIELSSLSNNLQAKFCSSCNFLMLVVEVLDHTVEQYSIFKTNNDINCSSILTEWIGVTFNVLSWYSRECNYLVPEAYYWYK